MKKIILSLALSISFLIVNAQSISNQVISSFGLSISNSSAQTDITIGETVVSTISDASNTITQGFHQTNLIVTSVTENESANHYQFYPNPVENQLNFLYSNTNLEVVNLQLFDVSGKLLWSKQGINTNQQIDFSDKPKGTYFIKLTTKTRKEIKVAKVIKAQ